MVVRDSQKGLRTAFLAACGFYIGFLVFMIAVVAGSDAIHGIWLPASYLIVAIGLSSVIPQLRQAIINSVFWAFAGGGFISLWFQSQPLLPRESSERFGFYGPAFGIIGPSVCGLIWFVLRKERSGVSQKLWASAFGLCFSIWAAAFFSGGQGLTTKIPGLHGNRTLFVLAGLTAFSAWLTASASGRRVFVRMTYAFFQAIFIAAFIFLRQSLLYERPVSKTTCAKVLAISIGVPIAFEVLSAIKRAAVKAQ